MKKSIFISLAMAFVAISATAQTEFRHITFDEACKAAQAENKKVFVDFYTSWCGPCKKLAKQVFPTQQVGDYLNANFVCIKLDAEKEGKELAKANGVAAYPTLMVFGADGKQIGSFAGYREGKDFIGAVSIIADPSLNTESVARRYESGERSGKLVQAYAQQLLDKADNDNYREVNKKVNALILDYFKGLTDAQRLESENSFIYTTYTHLYESPMIPFMVQNVDKFNDKDRADVRAVLDKIFGQTMQIYFTTNDLRNPDKMAEYQKFKKEAVQLGMGDKFKRMFDFTEKRAKMDDKEYMAYCNKNFSKLSPDEQDFLVSGGDRLFDVSNPEGKKAVCEFIRKHIGQLTTMGVNSAAYILMALEMENK